MTVLMFQRAGPMTGQEITRIHTSAKRKLPGETNPKLYLIKMESQLNSDSVSCPVNLLHGTENEQVENGAQVCLESRTVLFLDSC